MSVTAAFVLEVLWFVGVFALVALAVNLVIGHAGLFSLGSVGFFALGSLGTTLAVGSASQISDVPNLGLGTVGGILLGVGFSVGAALLIGIPSLRLRGDYFAIVTLGFGEAVRVLLKSYDPFVQIIDNIRPLTFLRFEALGLPGASLPIRPMSVGGVPLTSDEAEVWIVLLTALVAFLGLRRLHRSPWGRRLQAVRDDDRSAEALGKNTAAVRLEAFVLSAALSSVAGSLYAHGIGLFQPQAFSIDLSLTFLIMAIVGGLGSDLGSLFGATTIASIRGGLTLVDFPDKMPLPGLQPESVAGTLELLLFSSGLVALMLLRPEGMLGGGTDRRLVRFVRRAVGRVLALVGIRRTGSRGGRRA